MEAGAMGVEIVISGKLRTERARFEKFRAGYFPRCGEPALRYMRKAAAHVQLKPGIIGVRVKLMPPDAQFPDKIEIIQIIPPSEEKLEAPAEELKQEVKEEAQAVEEEASAEVGGEVKEAPTEEAKEDQNVETSETVPSEESKEATE
jgi:small subunit ribosomal protein S3